MKKTQLALAIGLMAASSAYATGFTNGGFEDGNLSGWTGGGGTWQGTPSPPLDPLAYNGGTPNNTLVGVGTDPITGFSTTYNGSYAVRVNDNVNNYSVSTIRQSVTNYTDASIFFEWNAVLEAAHGINDAANFSLVLHDDTDNVDVLSRAYSSAGNIGSGTGSVTWLPYVAPSPIFGTWYSAGWVVVTINLTAAQIGHDFTLALLASDCDAGGHAGYVYLDGFAPTIVVQNTPEPATLALVGLGALGLGAVRRRKAA